jgi:menaquinone-dependent protoporphyrinogen oxidase
MTSVLLIYASTHGHTAKVSRRIAERLRSAQLEVDLHDISAGGDPTPTDWDGVVVAGSIHRGQHQRELVDWAKRHHVSLAGSLSAFVSVSLTAAEDTDEAHTATQGWIDDFIEETGWTPTRTIGIAGALQYREYDFFTRTLMRLLMRHGGHPTDASRDYDFTDWTQVDRFGDEFATLVPTVATAVLSDG